MRLATRRVLEPLGLELTNGRAAIVAETTDRYQPHQLPRNSDPDTG